MSSKRLPPRQSPAEIAYYWVSRATSVALAMVTPGVVGVWFDSRYGFAPIASIAGFTLGFVLALLMLIGMANRGQETEQTTDDQPTEPADRHPN